MKIELFGIPTCESCRKARRWLDDNGVDYDWLDLRNAPPPKATISAWVRALGSKPLRNTSGGAYRALPEEKKTWSDARWVDAFASEPMLLKRPVLVLDGDAVSAGFKAEAFARQLG